MRKSLQHETLSIRERYLRIAGIILTAGLLLSLFGNILSIRRAQNKITDAKERVQELQKEHEDLEKQLSLVESEEYVESQLRDKLGMAKEGEIILVLPSDDVLRKLVPIEKEEPPQLPDPNWKKWMDLFM